MSLKRKLAVSLRFWIVLCIRQIFSKIWLPRTPIFHYNHYSLHTFRAAPTFPTRKLVQRVQSMMQTVYSLLRTGVSISFGFSLRWKILVNPSSVLTRKMPSVTNRPDMILKLQENFTRSVVVSQLDRRVPGRMFALLLFRNGFPSSVEIWFGMDLGFTE